MTIPTAFLDELRARTTLSTIVTRTVPLKKAGREWRACCPFHQEKTPSFYVNDEKGFYHCFGCSTHGDVIRWMTDQLGMGFIDAVKELAAAAGMEVPAPDPRSAERAKRRDSYIDINARAQRFFHAGIAPDRGASDEARRYLASRGISSAMIDRFGIGFAPHSRVGEASPVAAAISSADIKVLEQLGLVKVNPDTGKAYDFFRRRIMIPIHDARGQVIGFGGRIIGKGEPKYLNAPDTPVFDKGRTLFNLHRAAPAARAKGRLLIVEGYMDVIGLDSVGFDTSVAPNGTALTEHQLFLAWKLVDTPTVCFDGDKAGRAAAVRAALRALPVMEPGKSLRFASPPDGMDPDDLARKHGLEAVVAMEEKAVPLLDVVWRDLLERFDMRDPDRKAALAAEIRGLLASIRNQDVRASYGDALRTLFQAAGGRVKQAQGHHRSRGRGRNVAEAVEAALLVGIVDHPGVFSAIGENLPNLLWRIEDGQRLVTTLYDAWLDAGDEGREFTGEDAARAIDAAGMTEFVASLRAGALRLPFATETAPEAALSSLTAAIRENFT